MEFKKLLKSMLIGFIVLGGTVVISGNLQVVNAQMESNQTQMIKSVQKSGRTLERIGLKGHWYSLTKQLKTNETQVIIFEKDGGLDWGIKALPANNTMVTRVLPYHGWNRLSIRYPDNSYVYGFVKKASVKAHHKTYSGIYFAISNHKNPRTLKSVTVATRHKIILTPSQAIKTLTIK